MSILLEKAPPANAEAERAVVGALLLDAAAIDQVALELTPADFATSSIAAVYAACLELWRSGRPVDTLTVYDQLRAQGVDADAAKLAELLDAVPTAANVAYYARVVREVSQRRQLQRACLEAAEGLGAPGVDHDELVSLALAKVDQVYEDQHGGGEWHDGGELAADLLQRYDKIRRGEFDGGLVLDWPQLDRMQRGLQPGQVVIVAGRPSMGKSTFLWNVARQLLTGGVVCAVFSVEMDRLDVATNLACSAARVSGMQAREGSLRGEAERSYLDALEWVSAAPLHVYDGASDMNTLRARARIAHKRWGIRVLFVDYLQLLTSGNRHNARHEEVSEISRRMKLLARELGVTIVCAAQLNRGVENRQGGRPRMSDLRESGSIEQDADAIWLLHRESYYAQDGADDGTCEVIVAKSRNGPTGTASMAYDRARFRFDDPS